MTRDPLRYPKLRMPLQADMEVIQTGEGTASALVLRCPLGLAPAPLILVPQTAPILQAFNGEYSLDEIFQRLPKGLFSKEVVGELATLLDQHLLLDSPRYHTARREMRESYRAEPVRQPALAGLSYPSTPVELAALLQGYLPKDPVVRGPLGPLCTLVSPHIDYRRGGRAYGAAYQALLEEKHDLYVVIGTSHQYSDKMFHLTEKDFASPLGIARCDREFVQALAKRYGEERSFADEFLHRQEHSLELQIPFLQHFSRSHTAPIVPILVGSFYRSMMDGKLPNEYPEYEDFVSALAEELNKRSLYQRVCLIAGVDMAHVGQNFGDEEPLSPARLGIVKTRDDEYLNALVRGDKRALFSHIVEDLDQRRICGYPTMYLILDLLERLDLSYDAQLFDYGQAVDMERDLAVSFAAMGFYEKLGEKAPIL